jgi:type IV secretory pathway VirB10-like protein
VDALGHRLHDLVQLDTSGAGDPHPRFEALVVARSLSEKYTAITGKPTEPTAEALQMQLDQVKKEVEAADKRVAEIAAQEEAKRKREEILAEAKRKQEEALAEVHRRAEEAAADDGSENGGNYGSGSVQVRGYFRKNGTYVRPHTRRR